MNNFEQREAISRAATDSMLTIRKHMGASAAEIPEELEVTAEVRANGDISIRWRTLDGTKTFRAVEDSAWCYTRTAEGLEEITAWRDGECIGHALGGDESLN